MLASADETGVTTGVDLRMVGGTDGRKALLWQSRNPTGGVTCLAVAARPSDGAPLLHTHTFWRSLVVIPRGANPPQQNSLHLPSVTQLPPLA